MRLQRTILSYLAKANPSNTLRRPFCAFQDLERQFELEKVKNQAVIVKVKGILFSK
jgi:hypothetical protein